MHGWECDVLVFVKFCNRFIFAFAAAADITQLVWFENPGGYQPTPNWDVHVLTENVEDVYFRLIELPLNGDTVTAIVSSGFYRFAKSCC